MYNNFNYYTPTRVIFGKDTESQCGALIQQYHVHKVLIHYGGHSAVKSGLIDRVKHSLDEAGIMHAELGGVMPNPRLAEVYQGIEFGRKEQVDFILAVGGGSVIDSAKAIGYGLANDGDVWDFYMLKRKPERIIPVGVILTIAAAGSEMSNSTVLTNEDGMIKRGYTNDLARPVFAIMNPELTMTLPDYQTACGCTDILMHTEERYFTPGGNMELTDGIAEALMRTVIANARKLKQDPKNYDARAEIMWAGSLSHNGLTGCGGDGGDWACHGLEHELSALFDVAHGAGLAAVWGTWARYVYQDCLPRFVSFARNVMQVAPADTDEETALRGIEAMESFYRKIGMPTSLKELGISPTAEQMQFMAHQCAELSGGHRGRAKVLYEADMLKIYQNA
ncbi:MAG: iron-containing alcohol dehydrogenase [Solobacterium sp.]|jgi:alcohol dehydrogenase YqhD (iron-dependent ADH family)|nr:iron-containing alcohol dehydrogenase [Solobacterium sp.]MCH4222292.1 iron-containing alcohol dehydrogenase [Solobacterium sp.]MCH4265667.1 iron-containing alcohol dehydrogenase [Solobacterium sp.]